MQDGSLTLGVWPHEAPHFGLFTAGCAVLTAVSLLPFWLSWWKCAGNKKWAILSCGAAVPSGNRINYVSKIQVTRSPAIQKLAAFVFRHDSEAWSFPLCQPLSDSCFLPFSIVLSFSSFPSLPHMCTKPW